MTRLLLILFCAIFQYAFAQHGTAIDREALVKRHTINISKADPLSSLTIGNGGFAFTVDVTGLQSFPLYYEKGVPLGTQSVWGWHSFPNKDNYRMDETMKTYSPEGKKISYPVQWTEPERNKKAADYFRQNPHRLQLGNIGFEILKKDGSPAGINDIEKINQSLNMWTGEIHSMFSIEGVPVDVITYCHQSQDAVGVKVNSPLLKEGRLKIRIRFPYPTGNWADFGNDYTNNNKHQSTFSRREEGIVFEHRLDTAQYFVSVNCFKIDVRQKEDHYFIITPSSSGSFEFSFQFTAKAKETHSFISYQSIKDNSRIQWQKFWKSGGAVDLSGSTNAKAFELERRIILSQYLTKIQCSSAFPPQETGLTYNSWYGKPHLEMHWWHAVHFALWGRTALMEKSLDWYFAAAANAKAIAKRQGFDGLRWQKMTDHNGNESPSSVGSFLIWQQPHFIYMAELMYRAKPDKKIINKYKDLVFATADFMASFPTYDSVNNRYNLGKGLIPAQERFDPLTTYNPAYELAYWHWGLSVAQQWRVRTGLARNKKWDEVLQHLAALPQANGVYLATESTPDSYTTEKYKTDHPAVLATYSAIPAANGLDTSVMKNTFDLVWNAWKWDDTWGWDFPLTAMTATRLHLPEKAIDALFMPVKTNTWLLNGHNYQDDRLTIYLPGNGGLLSAIAMMCAGYDGNTEINPGFPKEDSWKIKWEGLKKIF